MKPKILYLPILITKFSQIHHLPFKSSQTESPIDLIAAQLPPKSHHKLIVINSHRLQWKTLLHYPELLAYYRIVHVCMLGERERERERGRSCSGDGVRRGLGVRSGE